MEIPQIDIGKKPSEPLMVNIILLLPTKTPFGNMTLKMMKIVERLDKVNAKINDVFRSYVHPSALFNPFAKPLEHQFYSEEVIY